MHVHVQTGDGEAKFWLEPQVELAQSHGLAQHDLHAIQQIVRQRKDELTDAWHTHFGS